MNPTLDLDGIDQLPASDQEALYNTLTASMNAFERHDADLLEAVYSDDADWVNAFGTVKKGGAEIVEYLRGLFADANFEAGELVAPPTVHVRRLTNDVVVVSMHVQIKGQLHIDGSAIELRDNHSLRVVARQPAGDWRIESEMFLDARTDQTYVNHG